MNGDFPLNRGRLCTIVRLQDLSVGFPRHDGGHFARTPSSFWRIVIIKLHTDKMIIPYTFFFQRLPIEIEKQVAFPAATNACDDLHKSVMPNGQELIYIKISFYRHLLPRVLHFGSRCPFCKTRILYHILAYGATLPTLASHFRFWRRFTSDFGSHPKSNCSAVAANSQAQRRACAAASPKARSRAHSDVH